VRSSSKPRALLDNNLLSEMLTGRVVIACVGNELRGDDGAGPLVARLIEETPNLKVVDCGETPENYLGVIIREKPEKVVVVDAVFYGGAVGEVRAVRKDELVSAGLSTHAPTLSMFVDFIESQIETRTYFIGIQPGTTVFGGNMAPEVEKAARDLAARINAAAREAAA
jgi:hydrogenase 3 maturation protease